MSKTLTTSIVVAIIFAGAGFAGGMQYQKSKGQTNFNRQEGFGNFQNLTQEQRDQMRAQFGNGQGGVFFGPGQRGVRLNGNGVVSGEILSKDDKSITVKLPNGGPASPNGSQGGSKIVFYSVSTQVGRFIEGKSEDVKVGDNVFVTGTPNDDGSLTAQNIQIRPPLAQATSE